MGDHHEHSSFKNKEEHGHSARHIHMHGAVDPALLTTQRGLRAITWSFLGLLATALLQAGVVVVSGSMALLADTIHNVGDAATAIPLWIAFTLARKKPTNRFSYGYGRAEDLAGVVVILVILSSAIAVGYESLQRFSNPQKVEYLWAVAAAAIVGFLGNEAVARFRLKVGHEIGSAALVAEGHHARTDGLSSLVVLACVCGLWLGFPLADPLVGLLITTIIFKIAWESGKSVFTRLLDGVDPEAMDEVKHAAQHVPEVRAVTEVRMRWIGHRLLAEVNAAVNADLSVEQGHHIAVAIRHELLHHLPYLSNAIVHIDPLNASGEDHHRIAEHSHDDFSSHSH
jgi:cation diffusion facilitator family transporter